MAGLIVILLYACKLAFLASSTCVEIIEISLKNEARKANLHVHKRIIIMPAIYERGLCCEFHELHLPGFEIRVFLLLGGFTASMPDSKALFLYYAYIPIYPSGQCLICIYFRRLASSFQLCH